MTLPKIGITLGDPGGVGPEVILKAFASIHSLPKAHYIIFGSRLIVEQEQEALSLDFDLPSLTSFKDISQHGTSLHEVDGPVHTVEKGRPSKNNGEASFRYFDNAVQEAQAGNLQAIITAPVSKHSWNLAGIRWAGHTDYLNHFYPEAIMFFWSDALKIALYTHHRPLREALERVKKGPLLEFFQRLQKEIKNTPLLDHELLIAGLNPHAGEEGLMGSEEGEEILPAIENARKKGIPISGPYPPDTVFRKALNQPNKIVIALYHDQGLIPFKIQAFEQGINMTLGLPFVRTSPCHGTAFDIAGKGIANPESMIEAIKLAHRFVSAS
ncbi:MAG: 4-hydroxythreonine-4-phosphate dehydrogenase PdxA [Candidatus Aminicenantes bacterium]|nr:4-hydroxythreonine-4-phosphate dehydrogenase PdxA [Candidatus Aminicenantes bacterium]MDH5385103.1 4-hydroxythreonine-4-phosphate dehydrogenase PdxA [Candidatus Aminicenantes bacterium]MDH5744021.1 4-hydroxythreonine-4-phosphate dehydrogenase PdxA [Candidatus Aminicenantes bacterium]